MDWYDKLAKPAWTPPGSTIGIIWTVLYPIIIAVFVYMSWRILHGDAPAMLAVPIAINVLTNIAFTPIEFGLRSLPLATADILVVLVTIVWCIVAFWPYSRIASLALIPYLAWVSTATVLPVSITWMNR